MKINNVLTFLEQIAPPSFQESYDNSGLIVGNKNWECTGALLTLDSLESTIDEAIKNNCNLIIAHHPIVFRGLKKLNGKNYVERTIIKAIKNDVAIYAIHTNLDNVHNGVNKKIADKLGLINTQILAPKKNLLRKLCTFCPADKAEEVRMALFNAGAGKIGNYDQCSFNTTGTGTFSGNDESNAYVGEKNSLHKEQETKIEVILPNYLERKVVAALKNSHPYEEVAYDLIALENTHATVGSGMLGFLEFEMDELDFLKFLKDKMGAGCVKYTNLLGKKIKKVALCGGSGSFLLPFAIGAGADIYITADYKYHEFFDADGKIIVADIGHYESEQYTIELLKELICEKFSNFAAISTKINTNPVNYL